MKRATKAVVTTVAVIGITAASFSFVSARGGWSGCDGPYRMGRGGDYSQQWGAGGHKMARGDRLDSETRMARMQARMADRMDYMKYKLQITAEQEPAWDALMEDVKQKVSGKMARVAAKRDGSFTVADKVKLMREGSEELQGLADSIETLYAQLTPEQQKIADEMGPMFGRHGARGHRR